VVVEVVSEPEFKAWLEARKPAAAQVAAAK
jgi:heme/copper-type cytochrome/quinol oxidase subunit 2